MYLGNLTDVEQILIDLGQLGYFVGGIMVFLFVQTQSKKSHVGWGLFLLAICLHFMAIALRWQRVGHGPFLNLYEILSSNMWSISLLFVVAMWRLPSIRASARITLPILGLLLLWWRVTHSVEGYLPPTYNTLWLYFHVVFGKLFFGLIVMATGVAGVVLARRSAVGLTLFNTMPDDQSLMILVYRFTAIGFLFETLMLVVGAIWAQDAWGRYWAWDPIETWSFLTWIAVLFYVHIQRQFVSYPAGLSVLIICIFTLAFLTFFGVPFLSVSPHKGMV